MKLKNNILLLLSIVALAITSIASVFAWYVSNYGIKQAISDNKLTANGAYYKSGNGTKDNPYVIANARHLYNLAWLQDLGFYDKQVFYFELDCDIDMSDLKYGNNKPSPIPAIGIDNHPFVGVFNGNGHTINNLFVASNFTATNCIKPSQDILKSRNQNTEFKSYDTSKNNIISSYNGLFGTIKKFNNSSDSESEVTNFTIANANIKSSQNTLVGYICGYVNSSLSTVGVAKSQLTIDTNVTHVESYPITKYGIIGDYNNSSSGIGWEDGGDVGYGTSTDIRALYDEMSRLNLVEKTTGVISEQTALPFKCSTDNALSGGTGSKTITTYGRSLSINYSKSISVADGATNIGYYSGPEIKTYKDYFAKTKASDDYEIDYDNITVAEKSSIKTVDTNIKEYLTTKIDDLTRRGDSALVLTGTNYLDGSTLGVAGGYNLVKNAKVGNYSGDLLIPYRSIWVAPIKPGKFQMIIVNKDTKTARLGVWKLQRTTPGNYSTGFVNKYYDTNVDGVEIDAYDGSGAYIPYYYGIEVTQDDIDNGYEFVISKYISGANVYITYIDIGANGSDTSYIGTINDIDFTYVSGDGYATVDTANGFDLSKVYFNIDGSALSISTLYVMRSSQSINLVFYYFKNGGLSITASGSPTASSDYDSWNNQE